MADSVRRGGHWDLRPAVVAMDSERGPRESFAAASFDLLVPVDDSDDS